MTATFLGRCGLVLLVLGAAVALDVAIGGRPLAWPFAAGLVALGLAWAVHQDRSRRRQPRS
jgi:hypothetical protein